MFENRYDQSKKILYREWLSCSTISAIEETPSNTSIESGYGSFRRRSKSCVTRRIRSINFNPYSKYPNFKISQLKYFGVDAREYLSMHNINYENGISKNPTQVGNGGEVEEENWKMQKAYHRNESNLPLENSKCANCASTDSTIVKEKVCPKPTNANDGLESIKAAEMVRRTITKQDRAPAVNDLKVRIQESIKAYELKCQMRKKEE